MKAVIVKKFFDNIQRAVRASVGAIFVVGLLVGSPLVSLHAEEPVPVAPGTPLKKGRIFLQVRTLEADGKKAGGRASISQKANDLMEHLEELPFGRYQLVSQKVVRLPKKKKTTVALKDGEQLEVRMHYLKDDRMGLWLHWLDGTGMELLNTRMHLSCGVPIVVGADHPEQGTARVLAVNVVQE